MKTSHPDAPLLIGKYRFAQNKSGDRIEIPTSSHLEGFLGFDDSGDVATKVQIFILSNCTGIERSHYNIAIEQLAEANYSGILPQIIDYGEYQANPYYITQARNGQFLKRFLKKHSLPPRKAASVVSNFLDSYLKQLEKHPLDFNEDSLWVEETLFGPELGVRDIALSPGSKPTEKEKGELLYQTFLDLFDGDINDSRYRSWVRRIQEQSNSLPKLNRSLNEFSSATFIEKVHSLSDRSDTQAATEELLEEKVVDFDETDDRYAKAQKRVDRAKSRKLVDLLRPEKSGIFTEKSYLDLDSSERKAKS